ncbi:MAG: PAS domain S-box protein, partial [Bacteroidota bacterium]
MERNHLLRILFVEDVPSDAELAEREIRKGDFEFSSLRVDTKGAFVRALEEYLPHVIVSDYSMPEFDGMQALKLSLKHDPTIPFIVLTGSMNEETAITCMKAGASDYVIKEQMSRLPFAVRDALEQRSIRVANKDAEHALRESEEKYRTLVDNANEAILVLQDGLIRFVNRNTLEVTGHCQQDLQTKSFAEFIHPDDRAMVVQNYTRRMNGEHVPARYMFRILTKEGTTKWVETASTLYQWNGKPATLNFLTDITERRRSENALAASEVRYRRLFESAKDGILIL